MRAPKSILVMCFRDRAECICCGKGRRVEMVAFYPRGEMVILGMPWPPQGKGWDMFDYRVHMPSGSPRAGIVRRWPHFAWMIDNERSKYLRKAK